MCTSPAFDSITELSRLAAYCRRARSTIPTFGSSMISTNSILLERCLIQMAALKLQAISAYLKKYMGGSFGW
ncbi:hypothetical protein AYI70_g12264 [Smittium culicis]|uniref:Uncharacterized protein n=1 Tax=Smittium culicis TaxID=133412 RepID=A0A1R1WY79_9FUNG|nr:hypothetical protein AYI70_g12264 [Smittium culicis]